MALELIPIGTLLAVLTNQVVKTANAAKGVAFEKESFKVLSKHLFDIEPVLKELQLHELNDSQAARHALQSLEADVKKVSNLVEKYKDRSRFYLLLKCRHIVGEIQDVTRDIGRSLASLSLANTEVLSRISDQVNRLQSEMQRVEFETSRSQGQIVDKLEEGLKDHKLDQAFANDMLAEIAMAVGVPVEPSEIIKELADFRKEKEEAANRKERAEEFFLGQVIELLSRADAARDFKEIKERYKRHVKTMERNDWREEYIRPLKSFHCRINGTVMVDPVSLCTGTTCERAAIVARFESGAKTDPETHEVLENTTLWSNSPLRQSIEEWRELRYCLKIKSLKEKLSSNVDTSIIEALGQMQDLMKENSISKDWISIAGITNNIVSILGNTHNKDVERKILITLKDFVEGHTRNKEEVIESRGWDHIISCLGRDIILSKDAILLLYELLQERSGWNISVCRKLSQQSNSVLYLVTLLESSVQESKEIAEKILVKLLEVDEENYSRAARAGWFKPLIKCIVQGPEPSRISMVRAVVKMELVDSNLKLLGEEGVIPPLIEMASGKIELKELSLSALVKLSSCQENRNIIALAGGVRLVLNLVFTPNVRSIIIVKGCEVLEKISSDDNGIRYFVEERGSQLELEQIVTKLLTLLQNQSSGHNARRPALRTLLAMCKFKSDLVKKAVLTIKDLSLVLPFLDDSDSEIREIAIELLSLLSQHELDGIVDYLLRPMRLEALVGFLENQDKDAVKLAAAGLLVNLPISEKLLTKKLIECNGHVALINILGTGTMEAKEIALSALFRFTDPENLESQRFVVLAGAYPLLVDFLRDGSATAKARAAGLIGKLSTNSQKLTDMSKSGVCWCFRPKGISLCAAHGGVCSVTSSFCLLEANALPELVKLLHEKVHETAYEAIPTLSTLVNANSPHRGASVLHEADAINPTLEILNWGTNSLKEEALELLEKVFVSKEMVQHYASSARFVLVPLTGGSVNADGQLARKAAKILSNLERYSKSSMSFLSRSSGN